MNRQQFREFSTTNHLQFDAVERNILLADNKVFWPELDRVLRSRADPAIMAPFSLRPPTSPRSLFRSTSPSGDRRHVSQDHAKFLSDLWEKFRLAVPADGRMTKFEFEEFSADVGQM